MIPTKDIVFVMFPFHAFSICLTLCNWSVYFSMGWFAYHVHLKKRINLLLILIQFRWKGSPFYIATLTENHSSWLIHWKQSIKVMKTPKVKSSPNLVFPSWKWLFVSGLTTFIIHYTGNITIFRGKKVLLSALVFLSLEFDRSPRLSLQRIHIEDNPGKLCQGLGSKDVVCFNILQRHCSCIYLNVFEIHVCASIEDADWRINFILGDIMYLVSIIPIPWSAL